LKFRNYIHFPIYLLLGTLPSLITKYNIIEKIEINLRTYQPVHFCFSACIIYFPSWLADNFAQRLSIKDVLLKVLLKQNVPQVKEQSDAAFMLCCFFVWAPLPFCLAPQIFLQHLVEISF
jgi:hypothetical protein